MIIIYVRLKFFVLSIVSYICEITLTNTNKACHLCDAQKRSIIIVSKQDVAKIASSSRLDLYMIDYLLASVRKQLNRANKFVNNPVNPKHIEGAIFGCPSSSIISSFATNSLNICKSVI